MKSPKIINLSMVKCFLALCLLLETGIGIAQQSPEPNKVFWVGQRIGIFGSNEENLYYMVPERWTKKKVTLEMTQNPEKTYRLTMLLQPSYDWIASLVSDIRSREPQAFFLPIPKRFTKTVIEFPPSLGQVEARLTPTDELTAGDVVFLRVELSQSQLDLLRFITEREALVTGIISYDYGYQGSVFAMVMDIRAPLVPEDLRVGSGGVSSIFFLNFYRDPRSDLARTGNQAGRCDVGEDCVFNDDTSGISWSKHRSQSGGLNMYEWEDFCEGLDYGGYQDWILPSKDLLMTARSMGLWTNLRRRGGLFADEIWWGSMTSSVDDPELTWFLNIDTDNSAPNSARWNKIDRALCIRLPLG